MLNKRAVRETLYIFLAISGAVMVFLNTRNYGPGITNDSLYYIYSGTHLNLLKGFFNFDGSVFINWPPFYSFIVFLLSCVSSDILTLFNICLCFLTVLLIGKTAEYVFTLPAVKIVYTSSLAFSYQLKRFSYDAKNNFYETGVVQVIFNNDLSGIDTVPDLSGTLSVKYSIIYYNDSYIIFRNN